jgi:hypothetical protein
MSAHDWLVGIDDAMTARLQHCTACGRYQPGIRHWFDIAPLACLAIAFVVCEQCRASDPQRVVLEQKLQERYEESNG